MNNQHPITPPDELVEKWITEIWHEGTPVRVAASDLHIATQAARWGADQELEASLEWLSQEGYIDAPLRLRAARRPKPPSLKEQALVELEDIMTELHESTGSAFVAPAIRRALEALND